MKILINNDFTHDEVLELQQRIKDNGGYCLCALIKGEDTKCMCKDFRDLKHPGLCYCGLYEKISE